MKNSYNTVEIRLPLDGRPLDIFDRPSGRNFQNPQGLDRQNPQRSGPPGHVVSDPEAGRMGCMSTDYPKSMDGQQST